MWIASAGGEPGRIESISGTGRTRRWTGRLPGKEAGSVLGRGWGQECAGSGAGGGRVRCAK
eukprot:10133321-Ditylum_brightwellii.AAC.1